MYRSDIYFGATLLRTMYINKPFCVPVVCVDSERERESLLSVALVIYIVHRSVVAMPSSPSFCSLCFCRGVGPEGWPHHAPCTGPALTSSSSSVSD